MTITMCNRVLCVLCQDQEMRIAKNAMQTSLSCLRVSFAILTNAFKKHTYSSKLFIKMCWASIESLIDTTSVALRSWKSQGLRFYGIKFIEQAAISSIKFSRQLYHFCSSTWRQDDNRLINFRIKFWIEKLVGELIFFVCLTPTKISTILAINALALASHKAPRLTNRGIECLMEFLDPRIKRPRSVAEDSAIDTAKRHLLSIVNNNIMKKSPIRVRLFSRAQTVIEALRVAKYTKKQQKKLDKERTCLTFSVMPTMTAKIFEPYTKNLLNKVFTLAKRNKFHPELDRMIAELNNKTLAKVAFHVLRCLPTLKPDSGSTNKKSKKTDPSLFANHPQNFCQIPARKSTTEIPKLVLKHRLGLCQIRKELLRKTKIEEILHAKGTRISMMKPYLLAKLATVGTEEMENRLIDYIKRCVSIGKDEGITLAINWMHTLAIDAVLPAIKTPTKLGCKLTDGARKYCKYKTMLNVLLNKVQLQANNTYLLDTIRKIPIILHKPLIRILNRLSSLSVEPILRLCIDIIKWRPTERPLALSFVIGSTGAREGLTRNKGMSATRLCEKIPGCLAKIKDVSLSRLYEAADVRYGEAVTNKSERMTCHSKQSKDQNRKTTISFNDCKRLATLYAVLCGRDTSLLPHLCTVYPDSETVCKLAFENLIRKIAKMTGIGTEPFLNLLEDPRRGCEQLLLLMLEEHVIGGHVPTTVIALCHSAFHKTGDARFIAMVLPCMPKDDVLKHIACLIQLEHSELPKFIMRVCKTEIIKKPRNATHLTPSEAMIALQQARLTDVNDKRKLMNLIDYCIKELRAIFSTTEVASAIEKLIYKRPLPIFFMRTIIQSLKWAENERPLLMTYVSRWIDELVQHQIWNEKSQWEGFEILLRSVGEKAFNSLLKMPPAGLGQLFTCTPQWRQWLLDHANKPENIGMVSKITLKVLLASG